MVQNFSRRTKKCGRCGLRRNNCARSPLRGLLYLLSSYFRVQSMDLSGLLVQMLNGFADASSLFMVAAGLSLIFGVTRIVNFAHGSFFMVGAYLAYSTIKFMGNPLWFWPALVIVGLGVGILGARMSAGGRQLKIRVPRAARARPPATRRSNGRQVFAIPGSRAIRESQGCGSRRFPS